MGNRKLNQQIISGIGIGLFVLVFSTIFYSYQLVYREVIKLQVFKTIEADLTSAQAVLDEYNASEHGLENLIPKPSLAVSQATLQDFLRYPSLLDRLLRVLSKPQQQELQIIFEQISTYESINSQEAYHAFLNQTNESFFITYHNKIEKIQMALIKNTTDELVLVHSVQLVLMGILLLYFLLSYIFIKKTRLIKHALENERVNFTNQLKENNYFLEQAQEIAKIGYYTYHFKDKTYHASKFILSFLGFPDKPLNLQNWIDCIHPNDQIILTSILERRLLNATIPLDVTYRIIRPKDGALRWIHHVADTPIKDNEGKLAFALGVIQDITEQKESALKLLNLNQIIASSLNEIYILNYDSGALIEVNDAVIFNLGYPKEVLLKLYMQDIAPEMTSKTLEDIRLKLTKTKTVVFESYHKRQNGLSYPVEIHIQKGKNGDTKVFLALVIDISERNQAKQSLLESENRWKLAIESTNDGLWDINFKTNTYYYSKRWKDMLGYQEHEIPNAAGTWESLVHPDDLERVKFTTHLLYDNKTPYYRAEYRMLCKDGSYKWVLDRGNVIERNEAKKPVRIIGVHTDISERKALEESLFNKSQLLAKHIDNTPLAFILCDTNSIIQDWNQAAETIFGYSKQEALGKNIMDLVTPGELKSEIEQVRDRILEKSGGENYHNENKTKSGKRLICNWHNAVIKDNNNQVTGFISIVEDVTEQSLVEKAVKQIEKITNTKTGDAYYQSLALKLNKNLQADYVVIGVFDSENNTSCSLAHTNKQTILPNMSYNLKGTPCEIVLGDGYCYHLSKVASTFITDSYLKENHIEAYLGEAIYNNKREIIGNIAVMYCKPIEAQSYFKTLLKLFADKIGVEIERNNLLNSLYAKQKDLESAQEIALMGNFNLNLLTLKGIGSKNYGKITELDTTKPVDFYDDWRPIVHPDDAEGNRLELENAIKTEGEFNRDFRIITKTTKTVKWLHSNGHIVFKDGIATNFIGSIQDITERKLTENLIKNRAQELLNAQKIAQLGSFNLDLQTMKGNCSEIFGQLTELDPTKTIDFYKEWRALVYPTDVPDNQKALENAINMGVLFQRDYRIITKNTKTLKWIHSIGEILYKAGKPISFIGTIQDITERKLAEELIKEREKELLKTQEIAHLGRFNLNLTTFTFTSSPIYDAILGIGKNDVKNHKLWKQLLHPDDYNHVKNLIIEGVKNHKKLDYEYHILSIDKKELKWIHGIGEIVFIDGIATNFIGTIQDITERKLAEEKLKQSDEILNHLSSLVIIEDANFNSTYVSPNIKELLGYEVEEILGRGWWLKTYDNQKQIDEAIKRAKEFFDTHPPKSLLIASRKIKTKDGGFKWIEWRITRDANNNHISIGNDISKRKHQELIKEVIFNITKKANEIISNETFFRYIQTELAKLINTDNFYIALFNRTNNTIDFPYITGVDTVSPNEIFPVGKSLTGYVLKTKQTTFLTFEQFENLKNSGDIELIGSPAKAWLGVPLMADNEAIGVITVQDYENKNAYSDEDVKLFEFIAKQLSQLITRKLAEEKLKQSDLILNRLDSIVQVVDEKGSVIYTSPSVEKVLGFKPDELLDQGWWLKTTSSIQEANEVRDAVISNILNSTTLKEGFVHRKIKTKNGEEKILQWITSKGVNNTLIFVGIDITEKVEKDVQFKKITETAYSAIILANDKGIIVECNSATERLFGYTKQEITGQPLQLIIPEKHQNAHYEAFNKAIDRGYLNLGDAIKIEGINKAGKVFPIEMSLNSWQSAGHFVFCAFIRDVSELNRESKIKEVIFNITKKANETLSLKTLFNYIKSELGTLINTNNFFIALYDKKTDLISTPYMVDEQDDNSDFPKGKTLTGYIIDTKKSLLATNKELLNLKHKKEIKVLGPLSQSWLGVPLIIENEAIGAIVIQSYTDVDAYTQKDLVLVELIAQNISQVIKQARDFEKINLLNQALVQSEEAVIITDTNGAIEYVNPAFTSLSGYTEQEVLGLNPRLLKSGEQPLAFYETLWNTILNGKTWKGEFINKRKDGSHYLIDATISPVKNDAGIITHFVSVQIDITEKRKLERDFIHAFIDAQEQEKQSFGEDLHDGISQILSAETMYVEVLNKLYKSDDPRVLDALAKIRALNLSAITDARNIAHGLMSKQLKESGLIIAVEHICEDYNQSKKIKFNFKNKGLAEDEISKEIKINLFRITQEISTNILRHSGAKNTEISFTKTSQNQLQLIVKDDGVGIDLEKMEREHKGAGLKNIERRVTLLDGKLKLDTAPNKGTCYTITVPLKSVN